MNVSAYLSGVGPIRGTVSRVVMGDGSVGWSIDPDIEVEREGDRNTHNGPVAAVWWDDAEAHLDDRDLERAKDALVAARREIAA